MRRAGHRRGDGRVEHGLVPRLSPRGEALARLLDTCQHGGGGVYGAGWSRRGDGDERELQSLQDHWEIPCGSIDGWPTPQHAQRWRRKASVRDVAQTRENRYRGLLEAEVNAKKVLHRRGLRSIRVGPAV